MLTNNDYCDYETCVALSELDPHIALSVELSGTYLLYEAQKWLREEKHIDVLVYLDDLKGYFTSIRIWESSWKTFVNLEERDMGKVTYFANYEEALSEGVRASIKILQDEQKENN